MQRAGAWHDCMCRPPSTANCVRQITVWRTLGHHRPWCMLQPLAPNALLERDHGAYWYFRLRGRLAQLLTQPSIELLTQPSIALSERVTLTPQLAPTEVPVTVLNFPAENALQQSLTCSLASDPHFNFTSSTMLPPALPAQNMNAAAE